MNTKTKKQRKCEHDYNKTIIISKEDIIRDMSHISKLKVSASRKDWIETTMYELREKSNKYERKLMGLLRSSGIEFIHQAPFIVDGKIYFADFYLPRENIIIEVDGISHNNNMQRTYDNTRDFAFGSYKIKTIRLPNEVIANNTSIKYILPTISRKRI